MSIQAMAYGGQWLAEGGTGIPHYVVNPDHVARLTLAGYQPVADPRIPADFDQPEKGEESPEQTENEPEKGIDKDDDTSGRLAAIKPANQSGEGSMDTASG